MHIWVDADACPGVIKEILYRVAGRTRLPLTLVANQWLKTPPYPSIRSIQVDRGFDVADNHIVDRVEAGDLVVTADIPLAAAVIDKDKATVGRILVAQRRGRLQLLLTFTLPEETPSRDVACAVVERIVREVSLISKLDRVRLPAARAASGASITPSPPSEARIASR